MIADAFGLELEPFRLTPDLRFYCAARPQREALAALRAAIERRDRLALLEGETGTGKTMLLKRLESELKREGIRVAFVPYPRLSLAELQSWFRPSPGRGRGQVLLIDEASHCGDELLAELHGALTAAPETAPVQAVLCGGFDLAPRLARSALAPLAESAARVSLAPLDADEVGPYIEHRLRVAGAAASALFAPDAVAEIARRARGLPRLVNQICARALLLARVEPAGAVHAATIADAAGDWPALDAATAIAVAPADRPPPRSPPMPAPPVATTAAPVASASSVRLREDPTRPKPPQPPPIPRVAPAAAPRQRWRRAGIAAAIALGVGLAAGGAVAMADPDLARVKDALRPYAAAIGPTIEEGRDAARRLAARAERAAARLLELIRPS